MNNSFNLIELLDQKLESKPSVFLNPKTGNVWSLYMQDDKLMVEVPNFTFQIYPLSATKFRPVNTLVNLELEFEQPIQHRRLRLHVYAKEIKRATFFLF